MRAQEQECTQEEVAESRIVHDDRAQVVGGDGQHAPLAHDGGEVGHLLGQQVELADDLARLAHTDDRGHERWLDELDLTFEDDIEVAGELALLEEHLTVLRLLHLSVRAENVDLLVGQRQKASLEESCSPSVAMFRSPLRSSSLPAAHIAEAISQVRCRAERQRANGARWVHGGAGGEDAAVHDEEVRHIPRLPPRVHNRLCWIGAHAAGTEQVPSRGA